MGHFMVQKERKGQPSQPLNKRGGHEVVNSVAASTSTKLKKFLPSSCSQYNFMEWRWYQSNENGKGKKKTITEEQRNGSFLGMVQRTEGLRFGRLMLLLGHCPSGPPAS